MRIGGIRRLLVLWSVVALAGLGAGDAAAQQPTEFVVNATHDAVDAAPGDGVCADAGGTCTLRAAVMESNALPGFGSISMTGTYVLTIPGAGEDAAMTGDLDITDWLGINGDIIDGGGLDRVFDVDPASTGGFHVSFNYLTIQNGSTSAAAGTPDDRGGGILNRGSATLFFGQVFDNEALQGGGVFNEGAFEAAGPNEISNNRAVGPVGTPASVGRGGGIYNEGTLEMSQSIIDGNSSVFGGGIFNTGEATIRFETTVAENFVHLIGGGIYNEGTITINHSTISGNTFEGLLNAGSDAILGPFGTATLTNSTISNSRIGISNFGSLALNNVTVAANVVGLAASGSIRLKNTIVGENGASDCTSPNFTSLGHNLDSDGTCGLAGPGDISNTDPKLGPLADNGVGPLDPHTKTHALLAGSPAIDAGDNVDCPSGAQNGLRPKDGNGDGIAICDIGAFEADAVPVTTPETPSPTPVATTTPATPVILPGSGGKAGSSNGISVGVLAVIAVPAIVAAGGAMWRMRRRPR